MIYAALTSVLLSGWLTLALLLWQRRHQYQELRRLLHEIRGPLTVLRLGLHSLLRRPPRSGEIDGLKLQLNRACFAVDQLSSWPQKQPPLNGGEAVRLDCLVAQTADSWRPVAELVKGSIKLEWQLGPVTVSGSEEGLSQALSNLIANGFEHGGAEIVIAAVCRGDWIEIEVSDGGCYRGRLSRVVTASSRSKLRGYGLAVVESVAVEHGGYLDSGGSRSGSLRLGLPAKKVGLVR